jgi:16S rRNA (guanine527-N7)-methyltransferase
LSLTTEDFQKALTSKGLESFFTSVTLNALTLFTQKMLQINETLNLTRWVEDEQVLNFHLLDSAVALPVLKPFVTPACRWVDLGTGCGFPGAVLITAFPEMEVTLLDSVAKKTTALGECLQTAGLRAQTLTGRAEEAGQDPRSREQFDGVVVRAVADFRVVLEYAIPLLKTGGTLVNWITEDQLSLVAQAQKALDLLKCKVVQTVDYSLPGMTQKRYLVLVQKLEKTSPHYPRATGIPSKHPL